MLSSWTRPRILNPLVAPNHVSPFPRGQCAQPHLGAERLGEDEHVAGDGVVRQEDGALGDHGGRDAADDDPRVADGLAARDEAAGLAGAVVEAADHEARDHLHGR